MAPGSIKTADPALLLSISLLIVFLTFFLYKLLRVKKEKGIWEQFNPDKARSSPHYIQGFHFLISGQRDAAIEEFKRVAHSNTEAPEVYVVIGNLYREKGFLEKAIRIHKSLLKRRNLTEKEEVLALFCLALDFEQAGFMDRAVRLFNRVIEKKHDHFQARECVANLYEILKDWEKALEAWESLLEIDSSRDRKRIAFLRSKIGESLLRENKIEAAEKEFRKALQLHPSTPPASINLGKACLLQNHIDEAVRTWEKFIDRYPEHAYEVIERLDKAYIKQGREEAIKNICRKLVDMHSHDWRIRLFLAGKLLEEDKNEEAMGIIREAIETAPDKLVLHLKYLKTALRQEDIPSSLKEYLQVLEKIEQPEIIYECLSCHYRSEELLWHCPHCQEWETFVEA